MSNWTTIHGTSFRLNEDLYRRVKEAKRFRLPEEDRKVRENQLFSHRAKCRNHS